MSNVYAKRNIDDKASRREAKHAMQKKQMQLIDEDGKLKRLEKSVQEKKQEIATVKRKMEKIQVELLGLQQQQSRLEGEGSKLEHDVATQRALIRRLEHEAEQLRQQTYRGSNPFGE